MSSNRHERRRARECALALLYSSEITEQDVSSIVEGGAYPDDGVSVSEYAEALVQGVSEHQAEIDGQLASISENWAIDRMPFVDRAILRVAVFEMLYVDSVPVSVAINEAVELAKLYGGEDDSSRFVNGVLGRLSRSMEGAANADGVEDCTPAAGRATEDATRPVAPEQDEQPAMSGEGETVLQNPEIGAAGEDAVANSAL